MIGDGWVRGQRYGPTRLGKRYVTGGWGVGAQRYAPNLWKIHELQHLLFIGYSVWRAGCEAPCVRFAVSSGVL